MANSYTQRQVGNFLNAQQKLNEINFNAMRTRAQIQYENRGFNIGYDNQISQMLGEYANDIYWNSQNPNEENSAREFARVISSIQPAITEEQAYQNYRNIIRKVTGDDMDASSLVELAGQKVIQGLHDIGTGVSHAFWLMNTNQFKGLTEEEQKKKYDEETKRLEEQRRKYHRTDIYSDQFEGFMDKVVLSAADFLPSQAVSLGASVGGIILSSVTGNPLFATAGHVISGVAAGLMEGGSAAMEAHYAGADIDTERAIFAGVGLVNGALEWVGNLGEDAIAKSMAEVVKLNKAVNGLGRVAINKTVKQIFGEVGLKFAINMFTEPATEGLQEWTQMYAMNLAAKWEEQNRGKKWSDDFTYTPQEMGNAVWETIKSTMRGQLLLGVAGSGSELMTRFARGDMRLVLNANQYTENTDESISVNANAVLSKRGDVSQPTVEKTDKKGNKITEKEKWSPIKVFKTQFGYVPINAEEAAKADYIKRQKPKKTKDGKTISSSAMNVEVVESTEGTGITSEEARAFVSRMIDENDGHKVEYQIAKDGKVIVDKSDYDAVVQRFIYNNFNTLKGVSEIENGIKITLGDKTVTITTAEEADATAYNENEFVSQTAETIEKENEVEVEQEQSEFEQRQKELENRMKEQLSVSSKVKSSQFYRAVNKIIKSQFVGNDAMTAERSKYVAEVGKYKETIKQALVSAGEKNADKKATQMARAAVLVEGEFAKSMGKSISEFADKINVVYSANDVQQGKSRMGWSDKNKDGTYTISLTKLADQSAAIHEIGHVYLDMLGDGYKQLAGFEKAFAKALEDDGGKIGHATHEAFAEALEHYVNQGVAADESLKSVFDTILEALKNFIDAIREIITPEQRQFFDDLFAKHELIKTDSAEISQNKAEKTEKSLESQEITTKETASVESSKAENVAKENVETETSIEESVATVEPVQETPNKSLDEEYNTIREQFEKLGGYEDVSNTASSSKEKAKNMERKARRASLDSFYGLSDERKKQYLTMLKAFMKSKKTFSEKKGLLAPNGKPSNLTPIQYVQVRTKEFIDWAGGDWRKGKGYAILDENNEPQTFHHVSSKTFERFNKAYSESGVMGYGFYFSFNTPLATFGDKNIDVFLKAKNASTFQSKDKRAIWADSVLNWRLTNGYYTKEGVDALFNKDMDMIVVFNEEQIKSAIDNNGEFSTVDKRLGYKTANDYLFDYNENKDNVTESAYRKDNYLATSLYNLINDVYSQYISASNISPNGKDDISADIEFVFNNTDAEKRFEKFINREPVLVEATDESDTLKAVLVHMPNGTNARITYSSTFDASDENAYIDYKPVLEPANQFPFRTLTKGNSKKYNWNEKGGDRSLVDFFSAQPSKYSTKRDVYLLHVTGAQFSRFSHRFMLTGAGDMAHGNGFYFFNNREAAMRMVKNLAAQHSLDKVYIKKVRVSADEKNFIHLSDYITDSQWNKINDYFFSNFGDTFENIVFTDSFRFAKTNVPAYKRNKIGEDPVATYQYAFDEIKDRLIAKEHIPGSTLYDAICRFNAWNSIEYTEQNASAMLAKIGFEGLILRENDPIGSGDEYIIFDNKSIIPISEEEIDTSARDEETLYDTESSSLEEASETVYEYDANGYEYVYEDGKLVEYTDADGNTYDSEGCLIASAEERDRLGYKTAYYTDSEITEILNNGKFVSNEDLLRHKNNEAVKIERDAQSIMAMHEDDLYSPAIQATNEYLEQTGKSFSELTDEDYGKITSLWEQKAKKVNKDVTIPKSKNMNLLIKRLNAYENAASPERTTGQWIKSLQHSKNGHNNIQNLATQMNAEGMFDDRVERDGISLSKKFPYLSYVYDKIAKKDSNNQKRVWVENEMYQKALGEAIRHSNEIIRTLDEEEASRIAQGDFKEELSSDENYEESKSVKALLELDLDDEIKDVIQSGRWNQSIIRDLANKYGKRVEELGAKDKTITELRRDRDAKAARIRDLTAQVEKLREKKGEDKNKIRMLEHEIGVLNSSIKAYEAEEKAQASLFAAQKLEHELYKAKKIISALLKQKGDAVKDRQMKEVVQGIMSANKEDISAGNISYEINTDALNNLVNIKNFLESINLIKDGKLQAGIDDMTIEQIAGLKRAVRLDKDLSKRQEKGREAQFEGKMLSQAQSIIGTLNDKKLNQLTAEESEKVEETKTRLIEEAKATMEEGDKELTKEKLSEIERQAREIVVSTKVESVMRDVRYGSIDHTDKVRRVGLNIGDDFTTFSRLLRHVSPQLYKIVMEDGLNVVYDNKYRATDERYAEFFENLKEITGISNEKKLVKYLRKILSVKYELGNIGDNPIINRLASSETFKAYLDADKDKKNVVTDKKYSLQEMMAIYEHGFNNGSIKHLHDGNHINAYEIAWVANEFENGKFKEFKAIADELRKAQEKRHKEIYDTVLRVENREVKKVDMYSSQMNLDFDTELGLKFGFIFPNQKKSVKDSFTQDRKSGSNAISLNYFTDLRRVIDMQEHYINGAEYFKEMDYLFSKDGGNLKNIITEFYGEKTAQRITAILELCKNDTMNNMVTESDGWVSKIRNHYIMARLAYNLSSVLQQPASWFLGFSKYGVGRMWKATMQFMLHPIQMSKMVYDLSPQMKHNVNPLLEMAKDTMSRRPDTLAGKINDTVSSVAEKGLVMMEKLDHVVRNILWWASYQAELDSTQFEEGKTEFTAEQLDLAQRRATQWVLDIQSSTQVKDNALVYSGNNAFWKNTLMFTNQLNKEWNMLWNDAIKDGILKGEIGRFFSNFAALSLATMWIVFATGKFKNNEDNDESWIEDLMQDYGTEFLSRIPVAGELAKSALEGYSYESANDPVTRTVELIKKQVSPKTTSSQKQTALKNELVSLADIFGLPTTFGNRMYQTFKDGIDLDAEHFLKQLGGEWYKYFE